MAGAPLPTGREEVEGRTKRDRAITEGGRREVKAQGSISKSFVHASRHVPPAEAGPDAQEVELFFFGHFLCRMWRPGAFFSVWTKMQMSAAFIPLAEGEEKAFRTMTGSRLHLSPRLLMRAAGAAGLECGMEGIHSAPGGVWES